MKLPGFLNKPRWQSKDAATRRAAVANDQEHELIADLGRLAREDADAEVRAAAMRRLADPGIVQGLAHDDADAGVRRQARALWFELLAGAHAASPTLTDRLRLLKAQDDNELIEHLARQAREPELRRAALLRTTRPALWFERALEDADPALRLAAAERIDDEAQLLRLAERARKSDKQVSRRARERVDALRIERGDDATLEQRARLLCERLEQLIREPQHPDVEAEIAARWNEIEARVGESLRLRYAAARNLLVASRAEPRRVLVEAVVDVQATEDAVADDAPAAASTAEPAVTESEEAAVNALLAQARFAASLDSANAELRQERERQQALFEQIDHALTSLTAAIEAGASTQAHAAKAQLDELRRRSDAAPPRALAQRLAAAEKRYAELSQWQHWADNQRRRQLCDEIEALANAGLHPDAVASRVREAQTEWARLDAIEGHEAAHHGGLARRFHAACRNALAPAQAYFKKRQELRQSHAQQVSTLIERVATLTDDNPDWPATAALRREVAEALRGLDRVEPRERKTLAERLKASLGALDARIARRDEEISGAKAALIATAEALTQPVLQRGAVAAARELQQRWQSIGHGRRDRDQAQWKQFRAALDAVFKRLDSERAERSARDNEVREQAEALCVELEAMADAAGVAGRGGATRLESAWDALRIRDDGLDKRFRAAQARLRDAGARRERSVRQARFEAWLDRYRLCRAAEQGTEPAPLLRERWDAAAATDIAAGILAGRFDQACGASAAGQADSDEESLREVLIELEMLAGLESPAEDRERRRTLQVDRLSARLRGGATVQPQQELAVLLARWTELGPASAPSLDARLERSLTAALETMP